jgi:biotin carboxyl carrier protein
MKTFTELKAEHEGVIDRFLVESGDPVDAGQDVVMLGD